MSRFYQDLHDRELLTQAALILAEVQERKLLDIFLPPDACMPDEDTSVFPRRLASVCLDKGKLALVVEKRFFQSAKRASAGN